MTSRTHGSEGAPAQQCAGATRPAVNNHQIIVAAEISQDANDTGLYQPMVDATRAVLAAAGVNDPIGLVLADAGY